jgi:hypothetical protein
MNPNAKEVGAAELKAFAQLVPNLEAMYEWHMRYTPWLDTVALRSTFHMYTDEIITLLETKTGKKSPV